MNIAQEIKAKRKKLGETRKEFGKRFDVHVSTVWRWESGQDEYREDLINFVHDCNLVRVGKFTMRKKPNAERR